MASSYGLENVALFPVSPPATAPLPAGSAAAGSSLERFLSVTEDGYKACLSNLNHDFALDGVDATLRLHYVRTDANGRPKFKELAQVLATHLGNYAIMAQRHDTAKRHADQVKIFLEAKKLLRRYAKSGEPGELLLYFLLEGVLKAPQAICKMSLKTNRSEEIKGSDGVHLFWDELRSRLILYFGESKLYKNLASAISAVVESIEAFHADGAEEHEVFLVSNHFNLLDPEVKTRVCAFLDRTTSPEGYEFRHACLIGFDWERYGDLEDATKRKQFLSAFESCYIEKGGAIRNALQAKLGASKCNHLTFEFFFIPFKSVQEFRDWFMFEVGVTQ